MLGTSWDIQSMCGGMRRDRFVVQKYGNTTGTSWDACIQQFVIRVTGSSEKAFVSLPIYCLESISVISWNILHQWHQQSYMGLYAAIESLNEDIYILLYYIILYIYISSFNEAIYNRDIVGCTTKKRGVDHNI